MLQAPCPRFVDLVLLGDLEGGLALLDDTMAVAMGGGSMWPALNTHAPVERAPRSSG